MANKIQILALLLLIGSRQVVAQPAAKLTAMTRAHSMTGRLIEIARRCVAHGAQPNRSSLDSEVVRLLRHERDPDVLARVALLSHIYARPGSAGDEKFDDVFYVAWDVCLRRIEQIGGQSAIDALEHIKWGMHLDGASGLLWKESMERLKAKQTIKR